MRILFGFIAACLALAVTALGYLMPRFASDRWHPASGTPRSIFETRRVGLA